MKASLRRLVRKAIFYGDQLCLDYRSEIESGCDHMKPRQDLLERTGKVVADCAGLDSGELFQRYQDIQRYVRWADEDVINIRTAAAIVLPRIPELVEDFYMEIDRHPEARKVITGGVRQVERLKRTLYTWFIQLLSGPYDRAYVARRWQVGLRHVEIGLDQVYANAALARVQDGLIRALCEDWSGGHEELLAVIQSVTKLINLDLAIIEDAYETEHVLREQLLERERGETIFRNLMETAGCMIVILRDDYSIAYFSSYAEQLTGYCSAEVVGQNYFSVFLVDSDRPAVINVLKQVLTGESVREYQNDILCKDSQRRTMLWNARRLDHYEEQPVCLVVGHDITSLKEAQVKALESERLAAIGQMSTGLAHESRNALQRIQASSEVLELEVAGNDEAIKLVQQVQVAQEHLRHLFDEVRGYAGPIILDRTECQLSTVWREAWELLTPQRHGRDAELRERIECSRLACSVDRFRMVQVFRNLLENSLAACSDPVEIEIVCREIVLDDQASVVVTFRDNGPGFNSEQREKAFSPFYTTKPKGTGLGLAIAQRVVESHGGTISVGGDEGVGAEIRIVFRVA
jgi:PAS domain S-box-containing protein